MLCSALHCSLNAEKESKKSRPAVCAPNGRAPNFSRPACTNGKGKLEGNRSNVVLARWASANPQSVVNLFLRRLNAPGGLRRGAQIRAFRLPADQKDSSRVQARNMYTLKFAAFERERGQVFIENPSETADALDRRWSHVEIDQPAAFDAFLQRVIASPAQGGNPAQTSSIPWQPRNTLVSLDALVLTPLSTPMLEDWEVRVYTVSLKGSASGTLTKGVIIEVGLFVCALLLAAAELTVENVRASTYPFPTCPPIPLTAETSCQRRSFQTKWQTRSNGSTRERQTWRRWA